MTNTMRSHIHLLEELKKEKMEEQFMEQKKSI